jgi:hypothetical protein
VVVEHPGRDRLERERLEHPVADLRVALDDASLRGGEGPGLVQDLLRDQELPDVVEAAGDADELDLLAVQPEPDREPGRELADVVRMAADVDVALDHRVRSARGRAQAGDT